MILVYVAGPYRAPTRWDVERNIRTAEERGLELARHGAGRIVPVIPHTMYRHFDGCLDDAFFLEGTKELLRRCDALALLPGWELSTGTRGELEEAEQLRLPIFWPTATADQAKRILEYVECVDLAQLRLLRERRRSSERKEAA
ncbi:DUF4406 domain-containing protein [Vulgatibacter sp.]|uniref:DUF7768 domain-containing protein n=1 Tax=Vulgatibacter sp. TaxID=1971226 RepID=UPI003569EEF4